MSVQGLVICRGISKGTLPDWVHTTMKNWCHGCKAGEVHCPGDMPEYYPDDCEHYNPQPIDEHQAQKALAYSSWPVWGEIPKHWENLEISQSIVNQFYKQYLKGVLYGTKKGETFRWKGPSDPGTKTAKDNDHTRDCVAYGQVQIQPKEKAQKGRW